MKNRVSLAEIVCWILSIASMLAYIFVFKIDILVFTKAFSILWLVVLAVRYAGEKPIRRHRYIILGLAFGVAGDVYLVAPDRMYFVSGALCFLTGHLFYTAAFYQKKRINPYLALVLAAIGIGVSFIIVDYILVNRDYVLGITAIAYIIVILVMAYFGISTGIPAIRWGSFLFVLSDALLSYNFFIASVPVLSLVLWIAYCGAQSLFTLSVRPEASRSA